MGAESGRTYTPEEKRKATERARGVGAAKASAELGIPMGTLSCWAFHARHRERDAGASAAPEAAAGGTAAAVAAQRVDGRATSSPPAASPDGGATPSSPVTVGVASGSAGRRRARVARTYTPSEVARALERVQAIGVRPAAKELGISRTTLRAWEHKARRAARGEGSAPTSGPDPKAVAADRDARILAEWRKQQGLGPSQIRNQLRRAGIVVSMQTVRRVMEEAGYRPPKTERRRHDGRWEAVRPNQIWHMDFVHRHVHRQPVFVLAFLDDYSRFVTGWALDDAERADAVIAAFEAAVARHGRPEAVLHDGGSAFWSWRGASRFTRILEEYGVDQIRVDVPETNGKIEVFNANLHKELFDRVVFSDVADLRRRLGPHFHWYNHHRTHHALGGLLVPADRFHGRVDEVMARIEAGGGAPDALDLATRTLELFRVVSCRGRPEVWLMGRKILDLREG